MKGISKMNSQSEIKRLYDTLVDELTLKQYTKLMGGSMDYWSKALRAKQVSKSKRVHLLADQIATLACLDQFRRAA